MTDKLKFLLYLLVLFYAVQSGKAQTGGYNYVRPDGIVSVPNSPVLSTTITPTGPSGSRQLISGDSFPTNAAGISAFGGIVGGRNIETGTGFADSLGGLSNVQLPGARGTSGLVGNRLGGLPSTVVPLRPTLSPITRSGVYGTGIQQQFAGSTRLGMTGTGGSGSGIGEQDLEENYADGFSAIPGVPGVDYPIFSEVPITSFNCQQQPLPGYYADVEAHCQVFHICALNRTYSFLCPNGTIFSQENLVCVWWNQFDCSLSINLYGNNAYIYDNSYNQKANAPQVGLNDGVSGIVGTGLLTRPIVAGINRSDRRQFQVASNPSLDFGNSREPIGGIAGLGVATGFGIGGPISGAGSGSGNRERLLENVRDNVGIPTPPSSIVAGSTLSVGRGSLAEVKPSAFSNTQAGRAGNREYLPPQTNKLFMSPV